MTELTAKQYRMEQLTQSGDLQPLHPETDASVVILTDFEDQKGDTKSYGDAQSAIQDITNEILNISDEISTIDATNVAFNDTTGTGLGTNVQKAIETLNTNVTNISNSIDAMDSIANIITCDTDSSSGEYLTKYTIKGSVVQTNGVISDSEYEVKFTLGESASKGITDSISSASTNNQVPTAKAVFDAIDALPEPMLFKGSVGDSGTVTWSTLPSASQSIGYTYKVITNHSTSPVCKVGDTIVSNGSEWIVIPSGDEPSGTVTSVGLSMPTGFTVSGSPITSSGTLTVTMSNGYTIPTTSQANTWSAKQNAITSSNKLSADLVQDGTTNKVYTSTEKTKLSGIDSGAQVNKIEQVKLNGSVLSINNKLVDLGSLVKANNSITASSGSVISYDSKGLVTGSGNIVEVGGTTPSGKLAIGGIFFKDISNA